MSHPSLLIFSVRCIFLLFYANSRYNAPMFVINKNSGVKILNKTRPFLRSIVRFTASPCSRGSRVSWRSRTYQILLGKIRQLLFLVAAGFLSIVLIACAGGGGGSGGSSGGSMNNGSMGNVSMDGDPGNGDPGNGDPGNGDPGNGDTSPDDDGDGVNNNLDLCPNGVTGWMSNGSSDNDGDGCRDTDEDIDDDGDGLIEIRTAEELNAVRHALDGSGRKLLDTGMANTTGCGGTGGITQCNGYELVTDISLADYVDNDGGKGWQPLGHDTNGGTDGCQGTAFSGTFEGNGFMISDLNISRSGEECVGLFGHIAANSEIRNLTLHAEAVSGNVRVGGLVGEGEDARIISSSVVVGEVSGVNSVGGLVGFSESIRIHYSSVVASQVITSIEATTTTTSLGGLVGYGSLARIISSSVVVGEVRGGQSVGGLVGFGPSARIISSSVVVDEVRGVGGPVGGLVGSGSSARIVSSSVVVGEVSGAQGVGGLVGIFNSGKVAYSYVVSGSKTSVLVGARSGTGNASYWDSDTSKVTNGNHGEAKTTSDLRSPTGYDGIYATWNQDMGIFGDEDEPLAVWCDRDHSGNITMDERTIDNLIWDFGESDEYPAIECTPLDPDDWRDWWSLNASGKPELNQNRLDMLLP